MHFFAVLVGLAVLIVWASCTGNLSSKLEALQQMHVEAKDAYSTLSQGCEALFGQLGFHSYASVPADLARLLGPSLLLEYRKPLRWEVQGSLYCEVCRTASFILIIKAEVLNITGCVSPLNRNKALACEMAFVKMQIYPRSPNLFLNISLNIFHMFSLSFLQGAQGGVLPLKTV